MIRQTHTINRSWRLVQLKKTTQGDSFIKKIDKTEDYNMQLNIPNWDRQNEFSELSPGRTTKIFEQFKRTCHHNPYGKAIGS